MSSNLINTFTAKTSGPSGVPSAVAVRLPQHERHNTNGSGSKRNCDGVPETRVAFHTCDGRAMFLVVDDKGQYGRISNPGSTLHFSGSSGLLYGPTLVKEGVKGFNIAVSNARKSLRPVTAHCGMLLWLNDGGGGLELRPSMTSSKIILEEVMHTLIGVVIRSHKDAKTLVKTVADYFLRAVWSVETLVSALAGEHALVFRESDRDVVLSKWNHDTQRLQKRTVGGVRFNKKRRVLNRPDAYPEGLVSKLVSENDDVVRIINADLSMPLSIRLMKRVGDGVVLCRGDIVCTMKVLSFAGKCAMSDFVSMYAVATMKPHGGFQGSVPSKMAILRTGGGGTVGATAIPEIIMPAVRDICRLTGIEKDQKYLQKFVNRVAQAFKSGKTYRLKGCQHPDRDVQGGPAMYCPIAAEQRPNVCGLGMVNPSPTDVMTARLKFLHDVTQTTPNIGDILAPCMTHPWSGARNKQGNATTLDRAVVLLSIYNAMRDLSIA